MIGPRLTFGPITAQMLAAYAEASRDDNPIHLDAEAARRAGFDGVIAHGLLAMAVMARAITAWAGEGRLVSLSARFVAPTPLGATISVTGEVSGEAPDLLTLSLLAHIDDGTAVITGAAEIRKGWRSDPLQR